jgi:UDP-N-acetyl-D-mannosaminuronic acid transferase (WecB/TagA/CpsF family)
MYYLNILKLKKLNHLQIKKPYILSALNATSITCLLSNILSVNRLPYFFWIDGIGARLITLKGKRIPGRNLLNNSLLNFSKNHVPIDIIGDLNKNSVNFLNNLDLRYNHIDVPIADAKSIAKIASKQIKFSHVILLLPSPKQELVSEILFVIKPAKYLCFGGALNMLSGNEMPAPSLIHFLGIEFLWRLQNDSLRRIFRILSIIQHIFKFRRRHFRCKFY